MLEARREAGIWWERVGTEEEGGIGPTMGLVDIGECEDAYLFRLSLPGVKRDESKFLVQ